MIEQRKIKLRRKGENSGPIDWKQVRTETIPCIVIILLLFVITFWAGSHYKNFSTKVEVTICEIYKEYKDFRVKGNH